MCERGRERGGVNVKKHDIKLKHDLECLSVHVKYYRGLCAEFGWMALKMSILLKIEDIEIISNLKGRKTTRRCRVDRRLNSNSSSQQKRQSPLTTRRRRHRHLRHRPRRRRHLCRSTNSSRRTAAHRTTTITRARLSTRT